MEARGGGYVVTGVVVAVVAVRERGPLGSTAVEKRTHTETTLCTQPQRSLPATGLVVSAGDRETMGTCGSQQEQETPAFTHPVRGHPLPSQ